MVGNLIAAFYSLNSRKMEPDSPPAVHSERTETNRRFSVEV